MKKTLVFGASNNPDRASYQAVERLQRAGHPVEAYGRKSVEIAGISVKEFLSVLNLKGVDTITLYVNADNQVPYYETLLEIKPRRIIFNPGTENDEFRALAEQNGIVCEYACTLVMLSLGSY